MSPSRIALVGLAWLTASSCSRTRESPSPTEKAAKDVGHAAGELVDKAGQRIEDATKQAGVQGDDAWITTKVKSELTAQGLDPLHVHVDTDGKVVTLSGTVEKADDARKAVNLAKGVKGVAGVQDHLFVKPAGR